MFRLLVILLVLFIHESFAQAIPEVACFGDVDALATTWDTSATVALKGTRFTPSVVNQSSTAPILFESTIEGQPSEVKIELADKSLIALNDKGLEGDKTGNDGIYSVRIAPPSTGWQSFLGYLKVSENGAQVAQLNLILMVLTPEMPLVRTVKIDNSTQFSDYVFNMVVPSTSSNTFDVRQISQAFYKHHGDNFDFINVVLVPGYNGNRYHSYVSNAIQGLGMPIVNNSSSYGSKGKLLGFNFFPVPSFFDAASNGYNHEIGHQWINYFSNSFLKEGIPHWPLSNLATGVMGFSIGGANGAGGSFSKKFVEEGNSFKLLDDSANYPPYFNDWEMYLMGLIPTDEVSSLAIIFKDQTTFPTESIYPKSAFNIFSFSDLIRIVGERSPRSSQSPKEFTIATIVLSETLLNEEEMAYFDFMAKRAEAKSQVAVREGLSTYMGKPFLVATRGKATLKAALNTNFSCDQVLPKPVLISDNNFSFCEGRSTTLKVETTAASYVWYVDGTMIPDQKTNTLVVSKAGSYAVVAQDTKGCNSPRSDEKKVESLPLPVRPTVIADGNTTVFSPQKVKLTASTSEAVTYQWQKENVNIISATQATYEAAESGTYRVQVTSQRGCINFSEAIKIEIQPVLSTSVSVPQEVELMNFPNPFSQTTQIKFGLPSAASVSLKIYTQTGREIGKVVEGKYGAGWHVVDFDAKTLPAGLYIYRLETNQSQKVEKKMIVE